MLIDVLLFAGLRQAAKTDRVQVEVEPGATANDLIDQLKLRSGLGDLLSRLPVRVAVNREYVEGDRVIRDGDEVALVPPISGGGPVRATVTDRPLDLAAITAEAGDPAAGAVVAFQGVTREVARLEYEAYREMAEERMAAILTDAIERFGLTGAVAEHRVGAVPLGEPSVIVAVSSPHRPEAFAGARDAIDRIKAEAPVWKIEVEGDGATRRVEGTLPAADSQSPAGSLPSFAPDSRSRSADPSATTGGAPRLTHLDQSGRARMVDVGAKEITERRAVARSRLRVKPATADAIESGTGPKGEVIQVARIAGVQAAKRTAELIPMAHPLPLSFVDVEVRIDPGQGLVEITGEARTRDRTGVEMEALTACSVAALTIYDMVKGVERGVTIEETVLVEKSGGRSGHWTLAEDPSGPTGSPGSPG